MLTHIEESRGRLSWLREGLVVHAWWPVFAFVAWSIYARVQTKYFAGLLTASGIEGGGSALDVLFLYRQDLLLCGVLLPLLSIICYRWLSTRIATAIVATLIVVLQLLLYANLQSWGQVGNFLSLQSLANAISFGVSNPEFIRDYITLRGVVKVIALLAISAIALTLRIRLRNQTFIRIGGVMGYGLVSLCIILAGAAWTSKMHGAPISGSFVANAAEALFSIKSDNVAVVIPVSDLTRQFEELSETEWIEHRGKNFGVHRGSNLLFFVLETGSIEFLDVRDGVPKHPVLEVLRDKMYRAGNHFSTFPASAESNLSILTGLYPPRAIYGTCLIDVPREKRYLPGPVGALAGMGYETALYAPFRSQVPADKVVFEGTGFRNVVYGSDINGSGGADERALARLLSDVKTWASSKRPFVAAFFPQIGHGPWSPKLGATIKERGGRVVELQLEWLMKIVDVLRSEGILEETIIVITGDHGVRTMQEDKRVKVGMIDWYSLHVPLLLYAAKADLGSVDASLPSSHVDLPVTLAQLFGLPHLPSYQGLAFDDPQRSNRRQFMMADWYYGANGFRDSMSAAMYSTLLDAAYQRGDGVVDFRASDLVKDGPTRDRIRNTLDRMTDVQDAWIAHRACEASWPPSVSRHGSD